MSEPTRGGAAEVVSTAVNGIVDAAAGAGQSALTVLESGVDVAAATGTFVQGVTESTARGFIAEAKEALAAYQAALKKAAGAIVG